MDFDNDGDKDLISGSYDPGEIYLFRQNEDSEFGTRETIVDKNENPIVRVPDQHDSVESFGSWVTMVDWDNDGDQDLLIGGFDGSMFVRLNEAESGEPEFATENISVMMGDEKLHVPGNHATPVVADWDGDGMWDILTGSDNGGVYLFRNTGSKSDPKFEKEQILIEPHDGVGYSELLDRGQKPVPGIRSQISVFDYNQDGKLDLLLGDFCTTVSPRDDLTEKEYAEFHQVNSKIEKLTADAKPFFDGIKKEFFEYSKQFSAEDLRDDKVQEEVTKFYEELYNSDQAKAYNDQLSELTEAMNSFLAKSPWNSMLEDTATPHGHVWLYLRK